MSYFLQQPKQTKILLENVEVTGTHKFNEHVATHISFSFKGTRKSPMLMVLLQGTPQNRAPPKIPIWKGGTLPENTYGKACPVKQL